MKTAIVIPVYKENILHFEETSLKRVKELFHEDIFFIGPSKIKNAKYISENPNIKFIGFENEVFQSIESYNKLMLSSDFYRLFKDKGYDWLLIAQLDSYLFDSNLEEFTNSSYDYFGAPWKKGQIVSQNFYHPRLLWFFGKTVFVGNGGLSLRKTESTIRLLDNKKLQAQSWKFNEDAFFAYYGLKLSYFKTCPVHIASRFAIETDCEYFYKSNGNKLPLGCHAFEKYEPDFYERHIPNFKNIINT